MKDKIKNPFFWIGVISIIFASAGIEFQDLTSWGLLFQAILDILNNPVAIVAVAGGVLGVFNDNGTKGLDKIKRGDR